LRRARKRKKFTQTQLAHELGEGSKATVSTWETGKAEPAEDTKDKLAKLLDIPRHHLDGVLPRYAEVRGRYAIAAPSQGGNAPAGAPSQCDPNAFGVMSGNSETPFKYAGKLLPALAQLLGTLRAVSDGIWGEATLTTVTPVAVQYSLRVVSGCPPFCRDGDYFVIDPGLAPTNGQQVVAEADGRVLFGWADLASERGNVLRSMKSPDTHFDLGDTPKWAPVVAQISAEMAASITREGIDKAGDGQPKGPPQDG